MTFHIFTACGYALCYALKLDFPEVKASVHDNSFAGRALHQREQYPVRRLPRRNGIKCSFDVRPIEERHIS